ncbi:hypothetical protein JCM8547_001378 [Rhodosporidiobolus lusitaniae]
MDFLQHLAHFLAAAPAQNDAFVCVSSGRLEDSVALNTQTYYGYEISCVRRHEGSVVHDWIPLKHVVFVVLCHFRAFGIELNDADQKQLGVDVRSDLRRFKRHDLFRCEGAFLDTLVNANIGLTRKEQMLYPWLSVPFYDLVMNATRRKIDRGAICAGPVAAQVCDSTLLNLDQGLSAMLQHVRVPSASTASNKVGPPPRGRCTGGIGQPLALLLKQNPAIQQLALFDVVPVVRGVAADISHVDTPAVVTGYTKENDGLKEALTDAQVVVIPAGVPRKPGMTRDDLFNINAGIVRDLAQGIADYCPKAFVLIISNPVNSTVPIAAEVLKAAGVFDPKRLFGVTTLDVVRSSTMSAQAIGKPNSAYEFTIPVVGGHSGLTILPLLSQSKPALPESLFSDEEKLKALVHRIQFGGDEVVEAKAGAGSATLSMAYAGYKFAEQVIAAAFQGKSGIVAPSYVFVQDAADIQKELGSDVAFFSVPVELGPNGAEKLHPLGKLSSYEQELLKGVLSELPGSITKGVNFIQNSKL